MMISRKSVIIAFALLVIVPTLSRQRFERWEGTTSVRRLTPPIGARNKSAYKGDLFSATLSKHLHPPCWLQIGQESGELGQPEKV